MECVGVGFVGWWVGWMGGVGRIYIFCGMWYVGCMRLSDDEPSTFAVTYERLFQFTSLYNFILTSLIIVVLN